jgi:hypothetical protein
MGIMRVSSIAMALAALCVAAPASAEPVYYHKANVARGAFEADLAGCVELAGGVRVEAQRLYSPNMYAMAAGAFMAGFMASKQRRQMTKNVLRTCMTDLGYRRVEATEQAAQELKKLDDEGRAERLFTLAAASEPAGKVLPQ